MLLSDGAKPEESLLPCVQAKRKVHVEQDDVYGLLSHQLEDVVRSLQGQDLLKNAIQQIAHRRQDRGIVINDKYGSVFVHGAKVRIYRQ